MNLFLLPRKEKIDRLISENFNFEENSFEDKYLSGIVTKLTTLFSEPENLFWVLEKKHVTITDLAFCHELIDRIDKDICKPFSIFKQSAYFLKNNTSPLLLILNNLVSNISLTRDYLLTLQNKLREQRRKEAEKNNSSAVREGQIPLNVLLLEIKKSINNVLGCIKKLKKREVLKNCSRPEYKFISILDQNLPSLSGIITVDNSKGEQVVLESFRKVITNFNLNCKNFEFALTSTSAFGVNREGIPTVISQIRSNLSLLAKALNRLRYYPNILKDQSFVDSIESLRSYIIEGNKLISQQYRKY